jgi:hypothetical protein
MMNNLQIVDWSDVVPVHWNGSKLQIEGRARNRHDSTSFFLEGISSTC